MTRPHHSALNARQILSSFNGRDKMDNAKLIYEARIYYKRSHCYIVSPYRFINGEGPTSISIQQFEADRFDKCTPYRTQLLSKQVVQIRQGCGKVREQNATSMKEHNQMKSTYWPNSWISQSSTPSFLDEASSSVRRDSGLGEHDSRGGTARAEGVSIILLS
jgi:hypothetical protein